MTTTSTKPTGSTLRTITREFASRALGRMLRLPAPTTAYTVSRIQIPMRDGVELVADHYVPVTDAEPAGTLLVRGPYGRGFQLSLLYGALFAARGYRVLLQSVRGTFGSGGVFHPMIHEAADGADTVAWLRQQPWFTGRFATVGASYLGFTQWALLQDPPPELAACVITAGPHDFSASSWGTGSFTVNDFLGWSDLVAHQEEPRIRAAISRLSAQKKVTRAAGELPLGAAGRSLLGAGAPWWESWLEHPNCDDPFWAPMRFNGALDQVQAPVLLLSGWQDLFLQQTLQQYQHLRDRGVDVALTVGPWTHSQLLTKGLGIIAQESQVWLDTHLGGRPSKPRPSRVRVFITGEGWRELPDWPPTTTEHAMYLQPDGGLAETPPSAASPSASFRYDPADPTPTIGGRLMSPDGGYRNDISLTARRDVLSFTSDALTNDLYVHGHPIAELAHASDNPHVDVFVRISEVFPAKGAKGRSRNVSDGYRRLAERSDTVTVQLDSIAHRFSTGSRIRVLIAGGCHPRYARNLGTGEAVATGQQLKPTSHEVRFGTSRVVFPVPSSDGVADAACESA
jgi:uncharacterized protein